VGRAPRARPRAHRAVAAGLGVPAVPGREALIGGERARTIAAGAAAAALALALALALFGVRPGDLAVPIWYEGDAFFTLALTKGLVAHGAFLRNPDLGAPFGLELYDFPYPYHLHLAALHVLARFAEEPGAVVNALWLLGFPAIAATTFAALRGLGLPRAESAAAAVLYCFLPYHLSRGEKHLLLSMYYVVPLAAALAVRLYTDAPRLAPARGAWPRVPRRAAWIALAVALALGGSGAYYAFFGCFFLAAAGALGALRTRRWAPLVAGLALVVAVCASALAGLAPSLLHWREHGRNPGVARRHAAEAEILGLKIAQLLLPVPRHPIDSWAAERARYRRRSPLVNENETSSLGLVAGAGFLLLVGWTLTAPGRRRGEPGLLDGLGALNLAGLLLATVGGFGSLVASILDLREIRAYNRLSIWLAFFALAALAAAARPLRERLVRTRAGAAAGALGLAALLALALVDVVSPSYLPDRAAVREVFARDRAFAAAVEAALPAGTAVFQIPHVAFPEEPPPGRMLHYDSLRPYLHARTLRWSHGAMRGRPGDAAIAALAALPAARMPEALAGAGYGAVLVDRFGLAPGAPLEARLAQLLGPPLASEDGRFALYPLPPGDTGR
jgi:phosphoglycerol transferase